MIPTEACKHIGVFTKVGNKRQKGDWESEALVPSLVGRLKGLEVRQHGEAAKTRWSEAV